MQNFFRMSYFMPPIAPIRNEQGQTVTPATLTPFCEVSVEHVYQMITCNENLKALTEQAVSYTHLKMERCRLRNIGPKSVNAPVSYTHLQSTRDEIQLAH